MNEYWLNRGLNIPVWVSFNGITSWYSVWTNKRRTLCIRTDDNAIHPTIIPLYERDIIRPRDPNRIYTNNQPDG